MSIVECPGDESDNMSVRDLEKSPPVVEVPMQLSAKKVERPTPESKDTDKVRKRLEMESDLAVVGMGSIDQVMHEYFKLLKIEVYFAREIELAREFLAMNSDFNLYDAFAVFDQLDRNQLSIWDFKEGLKRIKMKEPQNLALIFDRLAPTGKLTFDAYSSILIPKNDDLAEQVK